MQNELRPHMFSLLCALRVWHRFSSQDDLWLKPEYKSWLQLSSLSRYDMLEHYFEKKKEVLK